jgi:amino acid transporter
VSGRRLTVSARLGAAIAAGVPVLVLVSMGPIAALTGSVSVAVWGFSAVVGFFMALAFAELASSYPNVNGGVAVLAAHVIRPHSTVGARVGLWSYWLGWSPALAVNALLIGSYGRQLLAPRTPAWIAVLLAAAVLVVSVAVNHLGMTVGGRMQVVLVVCVTSVIVVLFAGALLRGQVHARNLAPFGPPGGWSSGAGWLALAGGLFMAGWSAYGSELALAYATRYRRGVRDAVRVLAVVAAASVTAFLLVPLLLVLTVGVAGARLDPAAAFTALTDRAMDGASVVVLGALVLALMLGLNMIAIGSSWTLHQMARSGDAPAFLGRLNRHGMPGNALRFDLVANIALLALVTVLARGDTATVPIALLAAANVGYFVSMCLALAVSWHNRRYGTSRGVIRLRPGVARTVPGIIAFNVVLLVAAGQAWGWRNIALGAAVLVAVTLAGSMGSRRPAVAEPVVILPACWGTAAGVVGQATWNRPNTDRGSDERTWTHPLDARAAPAARTADRSGAAGAAVGGGGPAQPGNRRTPASLHQDG